MVYSQMQHNQNAWLNELQVHSGKNELQLHVMIWISQTYGKGRNDMKSLHCMIPTFINYQNRPKQGIY